MRLLEVEIPMSLPSVSNLREHWSARAKRTAAQREAVTLAMKCNTKRKGVNACWAELLRGDSLVVTMTRVAPRPIRDQHDNLRTAMKASVDAVAAILGVDDSDTTVEWVYAQAKGPEALLVNISEVNFDHLARSN